MISKISQPVLRQLSGFWLFEKCTLPDCKKEEEKQRRQAALNQLCCCCSLYTRVIRYTIGFGLTYCKTFYTYKIKNSLCVSHPPPFPWSPKCCISLRQPEHHPLHPSASFVLGVTHACGVMQKAQTCTECGGFKFWGAKSHLFSQNGSEFWFGDQETQPSLASQFFP